MMARSRQTRTYSFACWAGGGTEGEGEFNAFMEQIVLHDQIMKNIAKKTQRMTEMAEPNYSGVQQHRAGHVHGEREISYGLW